MNVCSFNLSFYFLSFVLILYSIYSNLRVQFSVHTFWYDLVRPTCKNEGCMSACPTTNCVSAICIFIYYHPNSLWVWKGLLLRESFAGFFEYNHYLVYRIIFSNKSDIKKSSLMHYITIQANASFAQISVKFFSSIFLKWRNAIIREIWRLLKVGLLVSIYSKFVWLQWKSLID